MTYQQRKEQVKSYLGRTVTIHMDRPIGYVHKKGDKTLVYPINYGYIPGVLGGDGEELDVYLLGVDVPVTQYTGRVIGIAHRQNDVEDKLIAAPEGQLYTAQQMAEAIHFQEKYYDTRVEAYYEKSCGAVLYSEAQGERKYLLVTASEQKHCGFPKGHMEGEETEAETAAREILEETSLDIKPDTDFRATTIYTMPNGKCKEVVYFVADFGEQTAHHHQGFEHFDYRLLPFDEAMAALTFENARGVLRAAENYLNHNNRKPSH